MIWKGRSLALLDAAARGEARAAGIAYVFQGSNLLPNFTALENVAFTAWLADRGERRVELAPRSCWRWSASKARATPCPASSPAVRPSGWRWRGRSPSGPSCCSATSRPAISIPTPRARVLDLLWALQERFGFALVLATHDPEVAARCGREVVLADGAGRSTMSAALQLGLARLRRRPGRSRATQVFVLAVAVALLGAMVLFIGHSLRTMTAAATRSVPLDLQARRELPEGPPPGHQGRGRARRRPGLGGGDRALHRDRPPRPGRG